MKERFPGQKPNIGQEPRFKKIGEIFLIMKEPIEFTLDEMQAKGVKNGLVESMNIPINSLGAAISIGVATRKIYIGVAAGFIVWGVMGKRLRDEWKKDYEQIKA